MTPPKLPLPFILLWIANIAILLVLSYATGFHNVLGNTSMRNLPYIYLAIGAMLAALEQALWDKLKGSE